MRFLPILMIVILSCEKPEAEIIEPEVEEIQADTLGRYLMIGYIDIVNQEISLFDESNTLKGSFDSENLKIKTTSRGNFVFESEWFRFGSYPLRLWNHEICDSKRSTYEPYWCWGGIVMTRTSKPNWNALTISVGDDFYQDVREENGGFYFAVPLVELPRKFCLE